ncbi:LysM peptidoglycan-binding domain-containing protein [Glaciihabitans sp. dw_435]|uniref:LysM peptidoglycan-binding domain-containing protein n=1 Tax=Glaciihabitans sp. dw_435 TaxID=2720081 RepID=UPI0021029AB3|nr:LysM peptidoglycan-binding domain-containing protein [Glaciihabitans sp. dw_435]
MTNFYDHEHTAARSPLAGLVPTRLQAQDAAANRDVGSRERSRFVKNMYNTVPIVLVGSMALAGMGFTGTVESTATKRPIKPKSETAELGSVAKNSIKNALAAANSATQPEADIEAAGSIEVASTAPSTYRVKGGDTVSGIAGKYGLSTASVLAMNGLGWKSVIYPGQVLKLSKTAAVPTKTVTAKPTTAKPATATAVSAGSTRYTIRKGDTISNIAKKFGVATAAVLSANGLALSSIIYAGKTLTIPGKGATVAPVKTAPVKVTPVVVTKPVTSTPTTAAGTKYTIKSGDTVTSIAKKFGVTVQSILSGNGMTASTIIYAGRVLTIGGAAASSGSTGSTGGGTTIAPAGTGTRVTPLSPEMKTNATIITRVGQQLGVPDYGIVIALAAAMQESTLRNIDYGDRDSIGLFQQRPSAGWGTNAKLLDPVYAARLFFGGPTNPNKGNTRGLLDIKGWQSMTVTQAAQAVQISAYPNAYAKWEDSARAWFTALK